MHCNIVCMQTVCVQNVQRVVTSNPLAFSGITIEFYVHKPHIDNAKHKIIYVTMTQTKQSMVHAVDNSGVNVPLLSLSHTLACKFTTY